MIKFLAAVAMLIDHIGLVLFPDVLIFRLVGRVSMPLFAYALARGYDHSRMKRAYPRYAARIILFAAVSQFPFRLMVGDGRTLNIGFTWLAALCLLPLSDRGRYREPDFLPATAAVGAALSLAVCAGVMRTDYGIYGIALPVAFYHGLVKRRDYFLTFALFAALWGVYTAFYGGSLLNIAGAVSLPLIALIEGMGTDGKIRLPRWFYYAFYPAHIVVLLTVRYIM